MFAHEAGLQATTATQGRKGSLISDQYLRGERIPKDGVVLSEKHPSNEEVAKAVQQKVAVRVACGADNCRVGHPDEQRAGDLQHDSSATEAGEQWQWPRARQFREGGRDHCGVGVGESRPAGHACTLQHISNGSHRERALLLGPGPVARCADGSRSLARVRPATQAAVEMSRKYRHVAWYSLFVAAYMVVLYLQARRAHAGGGAAEAPGRSRHAQSSHGGLLSSMSLRRRARTSLVTWFRRSKRRSCPRTGPRP